MRILAFLFVLLNLTAVARADDNISSLRSDNEFHSIAGEVITVWYDSLLLDDGTGQIIVSVAPYTTQAMRINGRDTISTTGRIKADAFQPLVLVVNSTRQSYNFNEDNMNAYAPIPSEEVRGNDRYLLKRPAR